MDGQSVRGGDTQSKDQDRSEDHPASRTAVPAPDPRIARLEAELKSAQESGAADRRRLEEELAKARQERTEENHPRVNVPLFMLAAVRSGEETGREPVNRVPLPKDGPILFTLELATVDDPAYRAELAIEGEGKGVAVGAYPFRAVGGP